MFPALFILCAFNMIIIALGFRKTAIVGALVIIALSILMFSEFITVNIPIRF